MLDPGNFEVKILPFTSWNVSTDSLSYHFSVDSFSVDVPDFGLYAAPFHNLDVSLVSGFLDCGSTVPIWIEFQNTGSIIDSGTITLIIDSSITFLTSLPPA